MNRYTMTSCFKNLHRRVTDLHAIKIFSACKPYITGTGIMLHVDTGRKHRPFNFWSNLNILVPCKSQPSVKFTNR